MSEVKSDQPCVILLAGGEGSRVRALTACRHGPAVPKQYCALGGRRSMLACALDRAESLAPPERIVALVAEAHRRWWEKPLGRLLPENVLAQPGNRGTAVAVLLGVLRVLFRHGPATSVLALPASHYMDDELTLRESMLEAVRALEGDDRLLVLLGMRPDQRDPEHGWILPAAGGERVRRVLRVLESPARETATLLMERGALLNSGIFAGTVGTVLRVYQKTLPRMLSVFLLSLPRSGRWEPRALEPLYEGGPAHDFSRDVLEASSGNLSVLPVPECGWHDLATPARMARYLGRRGGQLRKGA